jgi:hypothetical protein
MLTNPSTRDEISDQIGKLHEDGNSVMNTFFAISSIAVGLRHILSTQDCDAQPMVSAIALCSMIEDMAQAEASRVEDIGSDLAQFLVQMRTPSQVEAAS